MSWAVEPAGDGVALLTVVTRGMTEGGVIQGEFGGGIVYIVSGMKSWLETGEPMTPVEAAASAG